MNEFDERGEPIIGDTLLLLINAHWEQIDFILPKTRDEHSWQSMIDTNEPDAAPRVFTGGDKYPLYGRTLVLLRTTLHEEAGADITAAQVEALRKEARKANQPAPNLPPLP
jgi:glycogen operon protein